MTAYEGFVLRTLSKIQATIAQSSCEAELLALDMAASEVKLVISVLQEMKLSCALVLHTDSTSAANTTYRRGLGRMKHVEIRELWLQDEIRQKRLSGFA